MREVVVPVFRTPAARRNRDTSIPKGRVWPLRPSHGAIRPQHARRRLPEFKLPSRGGEYPVAHLRPTPSSSEPPFRRGYSGSGEPASELDSDAGVMRNVQRLSVSLSRDDHNGTPDLLDRLSHSDEGAMSDAADFFENNTGDSGAAPQTSTATGRAVFEVLRLNLEGKTKRLYVKRRDLLRAHNLQPRDLRRVDPSLSTGKSICSISVREGCLLIALGGVRLVIAHDRALLFDPTANASSKFLDIAISHLKQQAGARIIRQYNSMERPVRPGSISTQSFEEEDVPIREQERFTPFELEMVEAALIVVTGMLDSELASIEKRVQAILQKLPKHINPVNLEELRSVKTALVNLESKADALRETLEDLMDDEDEMREMNLSSRPMREERRRQRERDRLEREREYELEREARRERALAEVRDEEGDGTQGAVLSNGAVSMLTERSGDVDERMSGEKLEKWLEEEKLREVLGYAEKTEEAMLAAEEALEEEQELEQVEDMLEYYLQRSAMIEDEAGDLLTGARDLEESIGVSLSARRFELGRLELTLSIGSFAAALGAMIAGIFGMNLKSTLEESVIGFWGTTFAICFGVYMIFQLMYSYAKHRRIL